MARRAFSDPTVGPAISALAEGELVPPEYVTPPVKWPLFDPDALEAPGANTVGVDANEGRRATNRFGTASDLDGPRAPALPFRNTVDHDGRSPASGDVAKLLRGLHVPSGDVDGAESLVVGPARGDDVRGTITSHCRNSTEPPL